MSCHYTIIRYVPDPIAEEFINIAVVVFSETEAQCSITQNWQRVANFGDPEDLPMLQEFCDRICTACDDGSKLPIESPGDGDRLAKILDCAHDWQGSIQVAEPRGSLDSISKIIGEVELLFLR